MCMSASISLCVCVSVCVCACVCVCCVCMCVCVCAPGVTVIITFTITTGFVPWSFCHVTVQCNVLDVVLQNVSVYLSLICFWGFFYNNHLSHWLARVSTGGRGAASVSGLIHLPTSWCIKIVSLSLPLSGSLIICVVMVCVVFISHWKIMNILLMVHIFNGSCL